MFNYFIQTTELSPKVIALLAPLETRRLSSGEFLLHFHSQMRLDLGSILMTTWVAYFTWADGFGFQNSSGESLVWQSKEEIPSDFRGLYALYFDLGELGSNEG